MVKSILDPSINYPEIRKLNSEDIDYETSIYETNIFDKDIVIALGQEKFSFIDKNIIYFPVYIVKDDKVDTQIGVYEIMANRQPDILDDDGDIDVNELGDLLFANVNLVRHLKANPEQVLNQANQKFSKRFRLVEQHVKSLGKEMGDCTLNELDAIWNEIKKV